MVYRYADELYHHGIKGQKWGVRRFQNKDGSLTPAGKERYYIDNDSGTAITKNSDGSYTVPTGFKFNRVGQQTLDVNKSGVLYVSYGKEKMDHLESKKSFRGLKLNQFH